MLYAKCSFHFEKVAPGQSTLSTPALMLCFPARRLAMYQEMDSEEEECTSHGGTLPRRDSVTSHQSARVVLRSQSTKSHRRTGSRAEAKRASILSKHTAFSSPMVSAPRRHRAAVLPLRSLL